MRCDVQSLNISLPPPFLIFQDSLTDCQIWKVLYCHQTSSYLLDHLLHLSHCSTYKPDFTNDKLQNATFITFGSHMQVNREQFKCALTIQPSSAMIYVFRTLCQTHPQVLGLCVTV